MPPTYGTPGSQPRWQLTLSLWALPVGTADLLSKASVGLFFMSPAGR